MSVPDLSWVSDLITKETFSAEDYKKILCTVCCHFLDICPSIEFADMRFETSRERFSGLHSGIVHKMDCASMHSYISAMAIRYSAVVGALKLPKGEILQKIGIGTCFEIHKRDFNSLLININRDYLNDIDDKIFQLDEPPGTMDCSAVISTELGIKCEPIKTGYYRIPPLKEIVNNTDIGIAYNGNVINKITRESDAFKKAVNVFMHTTQGKGSLIYIPLRAHLEFHKLYEIQGGLYLYNLSGKKIQISLQEIKYFLAMLYLLGTNERIQLFFEENKSKIADINIIDWKKLRNLPCGHGISPHHWPFGGQGLNSGGIVTIESEVEKCKKYAKNYIDDIDSYNPYKWDDWRKPPIRAIFQNTGHGNDLLTFMYILEKDLSINFENIQVCFKSEVPIFYDQYGGKIDSLDLLWFNTIALGFAIEAICGGLNNLRKKSISLVHSLSKPKIIIEYGYEFLIPGQLFFYLKFYEYLSPKLETTMSKSTTQSQLNILHIPYEDNCWNSSVNSLKWAKNYLYTCGIRILMYSGYNVGTASFVSEKMCFSDRIAVKVSTETIKHKKYPPFVFFGLPALIDPYGTITLINDEQNLKESQNHYIDVLFKRDYCED